MVHRKVLKVWSKSAATVEQTFADYWYSFFGWLDGQPVHVQLGSVRRTGDALLTSPLQAFEVEVLVW